MKLIKSSFLAVFVGCLFAAPLSGQRYSDRPGLYLSGGFGGASTSVSCPTYCPSGRQMGIAGHVSIGGSPSPNIMLGFEASGWRQTMADTAREYLSATAVVHFYPIEDKPFFLKAGFGVGRYGEETLPLRAMSAHGFVMKLGVGYDFRIANEISIAPLFQFVNAPGQKAQRDRFALTNNIDVRMFEFGARIMRR